MGMYLLWLKKSVAIGFLYITSLLTMSREHYRDVEQGKKPTVHYVPTRCFLGILDVFLDYVRVRGA